MRVLNGRAAVTAAIAHPTTAARAVAAAKRAAGIPRWRPALTVSRSRLEPIERWELGCTYGINR